MSEALWAILLWATRVLVVTMLIGTALPFVRTGAWLVRGWDFPRLQVVALCAAGGLGVVACTLRFGWRGEAWVSLGLLGIAMIWQGLHVLPYTPLWHKQLRDGDGADFRLVVSNLDFRNERRAEGAAALASADADVLLLIEIDGEWARALERLRAGFAHRVEWVRPEGLGIALWSRLPIADAEVRHLVSEDRASIHADLVLERSRRIRFVGVHPVPPGLPTEEGEERYDSRIRDAELMRIAREVSEHSDRHWVIGGDFNDVAWSHTTRLFQEVSGLGDPRVGRRMLNTYHAARPLLRYPLDHVFASRSFGVCALRRFGVSDSDHFGIIADLTLLGRADHADAAEPGDHRESRELIEEGMDDAAEQNEGAR